MKKKLITLLAVAAMLTSSIAVFAEATPAPTNEPITDENINVPAQPDTDFEDQIQGDIMLISNNPDVSAPVFVPSYISNTVTVTDITDEMIATTLNTEDAENLENTINYVVSDKTIVLGFANGDVKKIEDIKKGDKITVYTNSYSPAPLILPPQYNADVIFVEDNLELDSIRSVDVDTYIADNEMLVNAANTLALNIDETTEIVDKEGKKVEAKDLDKKDLVVIYSISTRSIPAQTTPIKVVVLGENEVALANIEAAKNEPAATPAPTETPEVNYETVKSVSVNGNEITNVYTKNNTLMVPLRAITETLGFTVEWDGETKSIVLNGGIYSLKIGENAYIKGRMMPITLASEPELKEDDLTYVPVEFFSEVLEDNSIVLNY